MTTKFKRKGKGYTLEADENYAGTLVKADGEYWLSTLDEHYVCKKEVQYFWKSRHIVVNLETGMKEVECYVPSKWNFRTLGWLIYKDKKFRLKTIYPDRSPAMFRKQSWDLYQFSLSSGHVTILYSVFLIEPNENNRWYTGTELKGSIETKVENKLLQLAGLYLVEKYFQNRNLIRAATSRSKENILNAPSRIMLPPGLKLRKREPIKIKNGKIQ